jgi:hypothetical protein
MKVGNPLFSGDNLDILLQLHRDMSRSGLILATLILCVSGCRDNRRLELAAGALSKSADACLIAVRDRGAKYETCPDCAALSTLATQYIEAGGFQDGVPLKTALVAEEARTSAWMARAMSGSGDPRLAIW